MNNNSTKWFSSAQEKLVADTLGWQLVSGSGAMPCRPGDVKSDEWLGECKTHMSNANSIYFNKDVWEKIKEEATSTRRYPVLFADDGSRTLEKTWCVCLSHSFDKAGINLIPYNKAIRKNITFSHYDLQVDIKHYKRTTPDLDKLKPCAYFCKWGNDDILIMMIDDFKKCCEG